MKIEVLYGIGFPIRSQYVSNHIPKVGEFLLDQFDDTKLLVQEVLHVIKPDQFAKNSKLRVVKLKCIELKKELNPDE